MNSCETVRALLARYVDGELDPADVRRVDNHRSVCEACARELRLLEREAALIGAALKADDVPARVGAGLWDRLRRGRLRWTSGWWIAAAAAASVFVAVLVGVIRRPAKPAPQVARVTACAGPVEIRSGRGDWKPLATYTLLRDGDRVRCGAGRPGTVVLNGERRIDLWYDTEAIFRPGGGYGRFHLELARGRLYVELADASVPMTVFTPVASAHGMSEAEGRPGPAAFELRLSGVRPEVGFLDRLPLLPAAHAAEEPPELEVVVHHGVVRVVNASNWATVVRAGQWVTVRSAGPPPEPLEFDATSRRRWWEASVARLARRPDETAKPGRRAGRAKPDAEPSPPPDDPADLFKPPPEIGPSQPEPGTAEPPAPPDRPAPPERPASPGPPAPAGLSARPDIGAVVLSWKPVAGWKWPVAEYSVYRRAPGDSGFTLVGRVPAGAGRLVFRDRVARGSRYEYRVAAAARNDREELVVGELSPAIRAAPADFEIYYIGTGSSGGRTCAHVVVEKLHDGRLVRKTFAVPPRDLAKAVTGDIGRRETLVVFPLPGVRQRVDVDFSTGYHLVRIVRNRSGVPRSKIIIENDHGDRREIDLTRPPGPR